MDEFKLIAIRPLARCHKTYLRVLKIKRSYVFYNQYDFSGYTDKNKTIKIVKNNIPDLYSFKNSEGKDIKISVSAVVGQNGSGKSSLVELFYVACYNLAISKGVLIDEETDIRLTEKHMMKGVNVEIFYHSGEEIRMLQFIGSKINHFELKNELFLQSNTELNLNSFFYTISINYSLHALNSKVIGDWVKMIFKKNDGYQTPIVLNPYRSEGNIEVNNEEYLIKSRLISNILGKISKKNPPSESLRNIIDDKLAYKLHINLRTEKFKYGKDKKPRFDLTKAHGDKLLPTVYKHFFKNAEFVPENTLLNRYAKEYIISKLINISQKYEPYRRFKSFYEEGGELEAYIFMLLNDNSHITIKLIQAINFLNNKLYFKRATSFALTVSYLSRVLVERANNMEMELIEILPPSFFNIDIEFTKGDRFNTMSSGEKQRVYSIATVLYHLNNVSSTSRKIQLYKYERVNIIFDELELYFHPDLQRTLVNDLLQNIKKIDLKDVNAINMLFITHSPFILSDVQRNNILVLEKDGTPRRGGLNMQTFGANIFDLLKDSFFLKNGPMGELAKCKINETIDWLQKKDPDLQEASFHKSVIDLIGEPILQMTLLEMFDKLTGSRTKADMIREKISELERQLENENN